MIYPTRLTQRWQAAAMAALTLIGTTVFAQNRQSPVDFSKAVVDYNQSLPPIVSRYMSGVTLSVKNTWDPNYKYPPENTRVFPKDFCTVKATVPAGSTVGLDGRIYNLLQFHFHIPAEHELNGDRPPMEVHFVHLDSKKQLGDPDSLLVIGAWIIPGRPNAEFDKIFARLPRPAETITVTNFNLARVLPSLAKSYRYPGGLTAPTTGGTIRTTIQQQIDSDIFPEIVSWVVVPKPIELSAKQISDFQALFPEHEGNSRLVRPIAGRRVKANFDHAGVPSLTYPGKQTAPEPEHSSSK